MDLDAITVTAHRSETEPFRLNRLERVLGFVCALGECIGQGDVLSKISKVHDHKGVLTVFWKSPPSPMEKELFSRAWSSKIGDLSTSVEHEIISQP